MKKIYKYPLKITDMQDIETFAPGKVIHAGLGVDGKPSIWIEVNLRHIEILRRIYVIGTGNDMPKEAKHHVGSFVDGSFVWHVYIGDESMISTKMID